MGAARWLGELYGAEASRGLLKFLIGTKRSIGKQTQGWWLTTRSHSKLAMIFRLARLIFSTALHKQNQKKSITYSFPVHEIGGGLRAHLIDDSQHS